MAASDQLEAIATSRGHLKVLDTALRNELERLEKEEAAPRASIVSAQSRSATAASSCASAVPLELDDDADDDVDDYSDALRQYLQEDIARRQ